MSQGTSTKTSYLLASIVSTIALFFLLTPAAAQEPADSARVEGASFIMVGDTVIITYELVAPPDGLFDVTIALRRASDIGFLIIPQSLTGAIGEVRGGGQKAILWNYQSDVSSTFEYAQDYWFEITATSVQDDGGIEWWYYAAAGAGILATTLIFSGQSSPGEAPNDNGLPDPPGIRPTR